MKHTPAPWNFVRTNGNTIKIKAEKHHLGESVATLTGTFGDDVTLANARLIESTPELLEALESILKLAEAGVIQRNETGKPSWSLTDELKTITRAAIAKAKGE